jgi:hypothetical protein
VRAPASGAAHAPRGGRRFTKPLWSHDELVLAFGEAWARRFQQHPAERAFPVATVWEARTRLGEQGEERTVAASWRQDGLWRAATWEAAAADCARADADAHALHASEQAKRVYFEQLEAGEIEHLPEPPTGRGRKGGAR